MAKEDKEAKEEKGATEQQAQKSTFGIDRIYIKDVSMASAEEVKTVTGNLVMLVDWSFVEGSTNDPSVFTSKIKIKFTIVISNFCFRYLLGVRKPFCL